MDRIDRKVEPDKRKKVEQERDERLQTRRQHRAAAKELEKIVSTKRFWTWVGVIMGAILVVVALIVFL